MNQNSQNSSERINPLRRFVLKRTSIYLCIFPVSRKRSYLRERVGKLRRTATLDGARQQLVFPNGKSWAQSLAIKAQPGGFIEWWPRLFISIWPRTKVSSPVICLQFRAALFIYCTRQRTGRCIYLLLTPSAIHSG